MVSRRGLSGARDGRRPSEPSRVPARGVPPPATSWTASATGETTRDAGRVRRRPHLGFRGCFDASGRQSTPQSDTDATPSWHTLSLFQDSHGRGERRPPSTARSENVGVSTVPIDRSPTSWRTSARICSGIVCRRTDIQVRGQGTWKGTTRSGPLHPTCAEPTTGFPEGTCRRGESVRGRVWALTTTTIRYRAPKA